VWVNAREHRRSGCGGGGGIGDGGKKCVSARRAQARIGGGGQCYAVPLAPPHEPLDHRPGFRSLFKDKATGGGGDRCAEHTAGLVRRRRWRPWSAGRGLARVGV